MRAASVTANDSLSIYLFVIGALLSVCGFMAVWILRDILKQVRDNTKHVASLASSYWLLLVRQTDIEDHLADRDGYKPVRVMPTDKSPGF